MLGAIAGADPKDPTASLSAVPNYLAGMERGLKGLRVGIDARWNSDNLDTDTAAVMASSLAVIRELGAEVREVTFPDVTRVVADWYPLCGIEAAVVHESTYPSRKEMYGAGLSALIETGRKQTGIDYQKIVLNRLDFSGRLRGLFEGIDLFMMPAQGVASPTLQRMASFGEDTDLLSSIVRYQCPLNMSGSPTITLPGGFTEAGTPIGFQFVSRNFEEALLVRAGWAFQQATDWHRRHPALAV
jgi:amidase